MEFGRTSQDRRSAAKEILDRGLGKPVERVLNLNANVKQMSDQELDSSIESLLTELRYKGSKQSSSNLLLDEVEKTDNKLETKE
jgi:hypothetical protein